MHDSGDEEEEEEGEEEEKKVKASLSTPKQAPVSWLVPGRSGGGVA